MPKNMPERLPDINKSCNRSRVQGSGFTENLSGYFVSFERFINPKRQAAVPASYLWPN